MNKKLVTLSGIMAVLLLGIGFAFAQGNGNGNSNGNGNGNGPGNGNGICDPQNPGDCVSEPQMNAYQNGGMGFVNPQTGAQWNGQQRGKMGRGAGGNGTGFFIGLPPASDGELPQEVVDLMLAGWLDEQQAYAIYDSVMGQLGETIPFLNIQRAETQHIAAWEFLFDRYGIEVPEIPVFDIPEFTSVADACSAAAEAEIANFGLYDTMLETFADYPDIYQVALALRNASEFNHLPAFQNCGNV